MTLPEARYMYPGMYDIVYSTSYCITTMYMYMYGSMTGWSGLRIDDDDDWNRIKHAGEEDVIIKT